MALVGLAQRIAEIRASPVTLERDARLRRDEVEHAHREHVAAVGRARTRSRVPPDYAHYRLASFIPTPGNHAALARARAVVEDPRRGAAFYGEEGVGKTALAAAIANECIERGVPSVLMSLPAILREIQRSWDPAEPRSEAQVVDWFASVPVLIMDDFGKERLTDWSAPKLWDLLNERAMHGLPIIVTSNKPLREHALRYAKPVKGVDDETLSTTIARIAKLSSLGDGAPWIEISGKSYWWSS